MAKDAQLLLYHFVKSLFYAFTAITTPVSECGNRYLGMYGIKSSVQPPQQQQKIIMWRRKLSCSRIKTNQGPVAEVRIYCMRKEFKKKKKRVFPETHRQTKSGLLLQRK